MSLDRRKFRQNPIEEIAALQLQGGISLEPIALPTVGRRNM